MSENSQNQLIKQLYRQSTWLKESWLWVLHTKVIDKEPKPERYKALDVGCGPGYVMKILNSDLEVEGVDIDNDMVQMCKAQGLSAKLGDAEKLPFEDDCFDIVYCTFLLLWAHDPTSVVREMNRVSKKWVLCLAEPDYGARIDYPEGISKLTDLLANGIVKDEGDPFIGRKLRRIFHNAGLKSEIGVHGGVWDKNKLKEESDGEWKFIEMTVPEKNKQDFIKLKAVWNDALDRDILFQYNPIFYAIGRK